MSAWEYMRGLFAGTFSLDSQRVSRRLAEWHLAGVMFAIGIVLLIGDTFALPPYEVVRQIASQDTWATFMVALGGGRLITLGINGVLPRGTAHARYMFASVSALTWALMLAGLLAFDVPLMLGPFLAAAVIVDLLTAFRAAQDARQADEREAQDGAQ